MMFKHLEIGVHAPGDSARGDVPLGGVLLLAIGLVIFSAPCGPASTLDPTDFPPAEEVALMEELTDWVGASEVTPTDMASSRSLRQVIRDRWTSFEVFRQYHETAVRHEPLSDLPFGDSIRRVAESHSIDGLLLAAMIEVESGFNPVAVSHRGAVGLMQVLPSTAQFASAEPLKDPAVNLEAGASYISWLLERYEGDLELALAAYNAGPAAVRRHGGVPPYRETRNYVDKVLGIYVDLHREVWQSSEDGELLAAL